jgi:hypothetical protein
MHFLRIYCTPYKSSCARLPQSPAVRSLARSIIVAVSQVNLVFSVYCVHVLLEQTVRAQRQVHSSDDETWTENFAGAGFNMLKPESWCLKYRVVSILKQTPACQCATLPRLTQCTCVCLRVYMCVCVYFQLRGRKASTLAVMMKVVCGKYRPCQNDTDLNLSNEAF